MLTVLLAYYSVILSSFFFFSIIPLVFHNVPVDLDNLSSCPQSIPESLKKLLVVFHIAGHCFPLTDRSSAISRCIVALTFFFHFLRFIQFRERDAGAPIFPEDLHSLYLC